MYEEDVEDFEYDFDGEEPDEDFDAFDEENGDAPELRIDPYRIFRKQYPPEKYRDFLQLEAGGGGRAVPERAIEWNFTFAGC